MLNVVSGYGPTAGGALASHMDVDKVITTIEIQNYIRTLEFIPNTSVWNKGLDLTNYS